MAELIVFDDVEQLLVDFLPATLNSLPAWDGVDAGTARPNPDTGKFIRVLVVGGTDDGLIHDEPTVVLEVFDPDEVVAANLAADARAVLQRAARLGWLGTTPFTRLQMISRPQNLPDPLTSDIRYTATYGLKLRGRTA